MILRRFAATAALLAGMHLLPVSPAGAEEIGRLFSTPAERARLDELRSGIAGQAGAAGAASGDPAPSREHLHQPVFLNGMVLRGDGTEIVWVNGSRLEGQTGPDGIEVRRVSDSDFRVTVRGYAKAARLRPGQAWTPGSGRVSEGPPVAAGPESSRQDADEGKGAGETDETGGGA